MPFALPCANSTTPWLVVPGVEAASLSAGSMPMSGDSELPFWIEGQPKPATESEMKTALFYVVEPDLFEGHGYSAAARAFPQRCGQ